MPVHSPQTTSWSNLGSNLHLRGEKQTGNCLSTVTVPMGDQNGKNVISVAIDKRFGMVRNNRDRYIQQEKYDFK